MSASDIGLFLAQLVTAWVSGFVAGYVLTQFKAALQQAV